MVVYMSTSSLGIKTFLKTFSLKIIPLRVREVANLTERKNPHTPVQNVKEFVCFSVVNFDPNYIGTGKTKWAEIFSTSI